MEQCDKDCIMHDDRWGDFAARCELGINHEGWHQYTMTGCTPTAVLTWSPNA